MNRIIRYAIQVSILGAVIWTVATAGNIELYCPMGGILGLGTKLNQGTLPCSMSSAAIFMAIVLFAGVLAIGKLFCGFVCPVGTVTEWMGKIGAKFRLHFRPGKKMDQMLRSVKYILLFFVLYETVTASELFCRKFDPYYGAATGFGADTVLLWSLAALVVTLIGSIFIKQFWCRYLCFLGAASNIFMNVWGALAVFALYFLLNLAGAGLSLWYLIAGLVIVGFLMELGIFRSRIFPLLKITVNQDSCNHCGLCSRVCPMDIQVEKYEKVTHPDCTMCTECVSECVSVKAVHVNGSTKSKFLPIILLLAFVSMGFVLAQKYEFSTISMRWGKFDQLENVAQLHQEDLKNVKCYGSSMSLYNHLLPVPGIYGLDTYASTHKVTVYYNPEEISEKEVKEKLFTPSHFRLNSFEQYKPREISVWSVGIANMFDPIEQSYLQQLLAQNRFIFGVETFFGEPVRAKVYFDEDSVSTSEIVALIESKSLVLESEGKIENVPLNFRCENEGEITEKISLAEFNRRMFEPFDLAFNDYDESPPEEIAIFEIEMPQAIDPEIQEDIWYLVSALSADSNILRFRTEMKEKPVAQIYFLRDKVDSAKIASLLRSDSLTYFVDENTTNTIANPFQFIFPGKTIYGKNVE